MSNPWAQSFEELRSPYLQEKKAKKDYDGDGKIESGTDEYMGSKDKAIKKAMAMRGKKKVAEHHQKDAAGNTIPHEDEGDGTPSSVEEMAKKFGPGGDPIKKPGFIDKALDKLKKNTPAKKIDKAHYEPEGEVIEAKIDTVDPKNKRKRRNERQFGKQTKPYDPDTKEMKTSMGKFMNSMRHDMHDKKRGVKTKGMKKEEVVIESDKKGSGSGTKDACYKKVKASAKVWPSAYASGRLVQCRKKGAANYGNSKKEEFDFRIKSFDDMVGECWKTHKKQGMKMKGGKMVPNCVPKNEEFVGEEGINKDPAFDIMRPGGANSPFNADGTPKRKSLNKVRGTAFKKEEAQIDEMDGSKLGIGLATGTAAGGLYLMNKAKQAAQGLKKKMDKKFNPQEEVYVEALKREKLKIDDSGKVKNKITINPDIKTEEAKTDVKKPKKAQDAGARGRRLLKRREYASKISGSEDRVPDDLRDSVQYENILTDLIKRAGDKIKSNADARKKYRETNPGGNITKQQHMNNIRNAGGDPSHMNSYEPEGEMIEASSAQQKAMNDAKMKKMEDDKVAAKKKKVEEENLKEYSPNVSYQAKGGKKSGKLSKSSVYSLRGKKESKKDFRKSHTKDIKDGLVEDMKGMSQKSGDKRSTESGAGMTAKGVAKYNRRTGGDLKTAVTTPPSKLKAGSKAANRRKSFCARSKSWDGPRGKAARRRWNCEFEPELPMIPESKKKLYNTSPLSSRVSNWAKGIKEGDSYVKSDRNKFGLPKDLKSVEKKADKKVTGVNYGAMAQSYVPQGEVIQEMPDDIKGAIMNNLRGGAGEFSKGGNFKDIIKSRLKKTAKDVINTDTVKKNLNMGEAKMTSSEKDKKEKYVKGMKKDKSGFTKRYGKDGESVMYATATKMAMKKEETLVEKPGDGYLGPTVGKVGIPNPIRLAKDAVDQMNRANQRKVNTVNKISPGSATMPKFKQFNKDTSAAFKNLFQSYITQGDVIQEKSCGKGEYYCNDDQKCKPIPDGYKEGKDGMLVKEAKYEKGASDYGKTSIRNKRAFGKGGNAAPPKERGGAKMIRLDLHKKRRNVKKNNKYGATNKPPVDGAPSDEFKKNKNVREGNLHKWFKGSKSKDGKGGWVNVVTGGTCASDEPGEGTPKCVSSSKRASMTKAERLSASRRKKKADPGQQSKSGAAKPTYVATDKKKK